MQTNDKSVHAYGLSQLSLAVACEPVNHCTCNAAEAELKHNFIFISMRVEKIRAQIFLI
jgi:hypothetical protein